MNFSISQSDFLLIVGTLQATPTYDHMTHKGQLVLSSSDGDSYRYHVVETQVTKNGSGIISLTNDYMPVVPTVTTTAETALSWKVGTDPSENLSALSHGYSQNLSCSKVQIVSPSVVPAQLPSVIGRAAYEYLSYLCGCVVI